MSHRATSCDSAKSANRHQQRNRTRAATALALAFFGLVVACGTEQSEPTNVLLLVADSLRADHLGCYGYTRDTSPNLDRLARDGVLFERAYSSAPWTSPAVASIFLGVHPSVHRLNSLGRMYPRSAPNLAKVCKAAGYRTGGVISHHFLGSRFGFEAGFDVFLEDDALGHDHVSTPSVVAASIRFIEESVALGEPFFLFTHLFDPHFRYKDHDAYDLAVEAPPGFNEDWDIWRIREVVNDPEDPRLDYLIGLYDEEIRLVDDGIGRIVGALERLGVRAETLVVFSADHGEQFLEHGWIGHTRNLHEELIRVPLIVLGPGVGVGRTSATVSTTGILATLVDHLGFGSTATLRQPSWASALANPETFRGRAVYAELEFDVPDLLQLDLRAVVDGRYKLILDRKTGAERLFDLASSQGEHEDVSGTLPEVRARLAQLLDEHERSSLEFRMALTDGVALESIPDLGKLGYVESED